MKQIPDISSIPTFRDTNGHSVETAAFRAQFQLVLSIRGALVAVKITPAPLQLTNVPFTGSVKN